MASHMACIGLGSTSDEEFERITGELAARGERAPRADGGAMVVWHDSSGARLACHLSPEDELECVTPSFAGVSRIRLVGEGIGSNPGCRHCDVFLAQVVSDDGEPYYRIGIQLEDIALTGAQIRYGAPIVGTVTAFAERLRIHQDEEAFQAAQEGEVGFAAESLVPVGLFGPDARRTNVPEADGADERARARGGAPRQYPHGPGAHRGFGEDLRRHVRRRRSTARRAGGPETPQHR